MHLTDYLITLVSVCASVHRLVVERLRPQFFTDFSPNFACRSEMWLFRTLLFLRQTGSRLPILEMCKIQFWQFRDCGGHIFPRFVTKIRIELKLISIDFMLVVNETGNRIRILERCKFRFRHRFHLVYNDYVRNSLLFSIKLCVRLRNVVR